MGIVLGPNQYGKAENRLVLIYRDGPRHEIRDLNVSTSLRGDFADAHLSGDQSAVLPTDTQRNTVFAFAKEHGVGPIEDYGLTLARHFVADVEPVHGARVEIEEYAWDRIDDHDHAFVRRGQEIRTVAVTLDGDDGGRAYVVSGLKDLTVLKSTGSEFRGFLHDRYTTLAETTDRILATSLEVRWLHIGEPEAWDVSYASVRGLLLDRFAQVHSKALQQTLWEMGKAVLEAHAGIAEIRLTAPNKHHFAVDLAPFELDNPNEVFFAADRPYGVISASVVREGAQEAGLAWSAGA